TWPGGRGSRRYRPAPDAPAPAARAAGRRRPPDARLRRLATPPRGRARAGTPPGRPGTPVAYPSPDGAPGPDRQRQPDHLVQRVLRRLVSLEHVLDHGVELGTDVGD